MRIVVPMGAVSTSRELWNPVDEQILPIGQVEHLWKNGLRVGIINKASWSALKATLDEIPDRRIMHEPLLIFKSGFPFNLSIDRERRLNTIFFYRRDGTMPGDSWSDSKRYLRIVHSPNPEDFNEVMLAVTPEVRQDRKGVRWEMTEQGSRPVPRYRGKIFSELSVFVTVPAGSVLVIGPSPQADNPIIFGGAFLTDEIGGKRWETIYFIAPRMVRTTTARK